MISVSIPYGNYFNNLVIQTSKRSAVFTAKIVLFLHEHVRSEMNAIVHFSSKEVNQLKLELGLAPNT